MVKEIDPLLKNTIQLGNRMHSIVPKGDSPLFPTKMKKNPPKLNPNALYRS